MSAQDKRVYEFGFEKGFTIQDYITLEAFNYYRNVNLPTPPQASHDFYKMAGKFCNVNPLELPYSEMINFITQFCQAIADYMAEVGPFNEDL